MYLYYVVLWSASQRDVKCAVCDTAWTQETWPKVPATTMSTETPASRGPVVSNAEGGQIECQTDRGLRQVGGSRARHHRARRRPGNSAVPGHPQRLVAGSQLRARVAAHPRVDRMAATQSADPHVLARASSVAD